MKEKTDLTEVSVTLKLKAEIRENDWLYYQGQPILSNLPFIFKTNKYKLKVLPVMPAKQSKERWVEIKVKFSGLSPELSNIINKGHMEKDQNGRIVGKLKEILMTKPSQIQALKLEENRLVFINDPYRTDIVALLDVLCEVMEGEFYYKNYPIKIGSQITFSSRMYMVSGTIISINLDENNAKGLR